MPAGGRWLPIFRLLETEKERTRRTLVWIDNNIISSRQYISRLRITAVRSKSWCIVLLSLVLWLPTSNISRLVPVSRYPNYVVTRPLFYFRIRWSSFQRHFRVILHIDWSGSPPPPDNICMLQVKHSLQYCTRPILESSLPCNLLHYPEPRPCSLRQLLHSSQFPRTPSPSCRTPWAPRESRASHRILSTGHG